MTNPTETDLWEGFADPDNPVDDRGGVFKLTISAHVDQATNSVRPSYGAETDARILETVAKYAEKSQNYQHACWFIEAEGISIVRQDGAPFRSHEVLKLATKDGRNMGKNQAPSLFAEQFTALGVSASYTKVGQDDSAIGRVFDFGSGDIALGGGFKKSFRLLPKTLMAADYVFDGEPRVITPRDPETASAEPNGPSNVPSTDEALAIVKEVLTGATAAEMLDRILAEPRLQGVPSIFGVPLVEAATDESLVGVLQENRAMALGGNGTLVAL